MEFPKGSLCRLTAMRAVSSCLPLYEKGVWHGFAIALAESPFQTQKTAFRGCFLCLVVKIEKEHAEMAGFGRLQCIYFFITTENLLPFPFMESTVSFHPCKSVIFLNSILGGKLMRGDRSSYFDGWISISAPSGERAGAAAVSLTEIADRSRENAASK